MAASLGSLNIRKFDPSTMKQWRTIIFVGKRGSGKSVLMKGSYWRSQTFPNTPATRSLSHHSRATDIINRLKHHVDFGLAMTPTEESAAFFRSILPPTSVYEDFDAGALKRTIQFQRSYMRKNKGKYFHVMVLMDDCMYDKKIMKGNDIRDLFMNGRHLKITFCNALQYCMDMGPDLRSNTDYVFCLRENIIENRKKLFTFFFGMFTLESGSTGQVFRS